MGKSVMVAFDYSKLLYAASTTNARPTFYYHTDHLGSSSYITNDNGQVTQTLAYMPYGESWVDKTSYNPVYTTSHKFNGKELDAESGYSYYGARYYAGNVGVSEDSELGIWLSVDPMAHKYPHLSSYVYCANNPVVLTDPNGMEIWVNGDEGRYQYHKGKLYEGGYAKGKEEYNGNDGFANRVKKDLNTLKENGQEEFINALDESKHRHNITKTNGKNSAEPDNRKEVTDHVKTGSTIYYNPELTSTVDGERPSIIGLAHEISHAYDFSEGKDNANTIHLGPTYINCDDKGSLYFFSPKSLLKAEQTAVNRENAVRKNMGVPPRTTYLGLKIGGEIKLKFGI
jgi:RHS repeat-associated protein